MDLDATIVARRAIRRYRNRRVPAGLVRQLLKLALHAPSSMNGQPWHFLIVRNPDTKRALANIKNKYCPPEKRAFKANFIEQATILVICIDERLSHQRTVENAVLAAALFMLSARSRGLGTVYMSAYQPGKPGLQRELRKLLRLPKHISPVTIIPFGYPAEEPAKKQLRNLKEITHFERY